MEDLFPETIDRAQHGAVWWIGAYQCRNWHGFLQSREGSNGPWTFYVEGFTDGEAGSEETAHVATVEQGRNRSEGARPCPIDKQGRLHIMGLKFGRDRWQH